MLNCMPKIIKITGTNAKQVLKVFFKFLQRWYNRLRDIFQIAEKKLWTIDTKLINVGNILLSLLF